MSLQTVAFVGLGYIGLPTAVVMANQGLDVVGVDINAKVVDRINQGEIDIVEPGLKTALNSALRNGKFHATTSMVAADTYIIAVPTPFTANHNVDMKYIYSAAEAIAPLLKGDELIILESTSPPNSTKRLAARICELRPDLISDDKEIGGERPVVYFAHCPERILPGNALEELVSNDRIIGGQSEEATTRASQIYRTFCKGELLATDAVTAEMTKLTENSFRDVNIAFANELSVICDQLGIDVWELISLANHHPRVNILQPGPGVGGHCIAVDPWFIVASDPKNSQLIRTARQVNDRKPKWVVEKVCQAVEKSNATKIAILGLSFKANIDDLRESPSVEITRLVAEKFQELDILAVEPNVTELPESLKVFNNVKLGQVEDSVNAAEVIVLLVDHEEFKLIPISSLQGKSIIDTKGIWGSV